MDQRTAILAPLTRQKLHPRHGAVMEKTAGMPVEVMDGSLIAAFEAQVQRTPDRPAIQSVAGALSYGEFNAAANRLAHRILALALPPSSTVAVVLENSSDGLVAIYAVLKSGHKCAFLDRELPTVRLSKLLASAQAACVITRSACQAQLTTAMPAGLPLLLVEETSHELLSANPGIPIAPHQPAMVRFTSGSTGEPKRTLRTHRQLLYGVWQYVNDYGCSPADRHALAESLSASTGSRVTFCPLLSGGSIHILDTPLANVQALSQWAERHAITVLYLPTVALRALLQTLDGNACLPDVRIVHVGGQTVFRRDAEQFVQRFADGAVLVCRYAMSELGSLTHFLVDRHTRLQDDTVPAGYALPGREILIVDDAGRDQGFDQPGEIAVRQLLAPESEIVTEDPAADAGEAGDHAIFRTADLGLLRPDGCLILLGRKDDMVKVRGNRVALAEAERLLLGVAGVAQAAIKSLPTASGDNRLVGYVLPVANAQLTPAGIRNELDKLAPSYMIPARFVVLSAMPLTVSGKVDRQALPPPGTARPTLDTPFVAPRTELEQQIADIWGELLELDQLGVDDNFFELGGDSLSLLRLTLMVEDRLGLSIPSAYYRVPTISNLTRILSGEPSAAPCAIAHTGFDSAAEESSPTQWEAALYGQGTSPIARVQNAILRRGPVYRSLALPYAFGTRLQRAWLRQHAIQDWTFAEQSKLFRRCLTEAGLADPQDNYLTLNLMANTWRSWRMQALQSPTNRTRWVALEGAEQIQAAVNRGNGLIIVFTHQRFSGPLTKQLLLGYGVSETRVVAGTRPSSDMTAKEALRAQNARDGLGILRRGGALLIAGEGRGTTSPVRIPFYGRQLPIPRGFAELALHSQAAVAAVFSDMSVAGRVTLEFTLLSPPATQAEADELVRHYGNMLVLRWPRLLPTTVWARLQYIQSLPASVFGTGLPAPVNRKSQ